MSALANVLYDKGNEVVGSDYGNDFYTSLSVQKFKIYPLDTILDGYIYIVGNAYVGSKVHLELIERDFKVYRYNEFIGEMEGLMIAVSGTHGKTTTTSFLVDLFKNEKADSIIGDGRGKGFIDNQYLILEACEYRKTFLAYHPYCLVVTNIELEHTDFYSNVEEITDAFQTIANQSRMILVNGDDPNAQKLSHPNKITFGFQQNNDYVISILDEKMPKRIRITYQDTSFYYTIPFYGKHMIYDIVSGICVSKIFGIDEVQKKIDSSHLPKRRCEEKEVNGRIVISDYAHHPTEIKASISALKEKYKLPISLVFQPHTFSRTLDLEKDFIEVLSTVDDLYLAPVFSSEREKNRFDIICLKDKIKGAKEFHSIKDIRILPNHLLVFMGAGDIDKNLDHLDEIEWN